MLPDAVGLALPSSPAAAFRGSGLSAFSGHPRNFLLTNVPHMRYVAHMSDRPLLSTAEAANQLGCSVATLNRRVNNGDLVPALQAPGENGARFYRPADIAALKTEATA